jgi:hypothetical protein
MDQIKSVIMNNPSPNKWFYFNIDDETMNLIEETSNNIELLKFITSILDNIEDIEITSKVIKYEFEFKPFVYFTYKKLNIKYSLTITYDSRSYPYWLIESL